MFGDHARLPFRNMLFAISARNTIHETLRLNGRLIFIISEDVGQGDIDIFIFILLL